MNNIVVRKFLGRSRLAEELVEDVLITDHQNAMFARDVEELVAECLELEKMSQETWKYVLGLLFSDEFTNDLGELGGMMNTATSKISYVFGQVQDLLEKAEKQGYPIKEASDFKLAWRAIEQIKNDTKKKFPPLDEKTIRESLETYQRGDYQAP